MKAKVKTHSNIWNKNNNCLSGSDNLFNSDIDDNNYTPNYHLGEM